MDAERESLAVKIRVGTRKKRWARNERKGGNIYLEHLPHLLRCQFQVLWNENKEPDGIRKTLGLNKKKKKKTIQSILFAEKIDTR